MTLYLTDRTTPDEITRAKASGVVFAVKLYPAGATTNSDAGVTDLERLRPTLQRMADVGLPLCVHGEVTDAAIDVFEREPVFIERVLRPLVASLPSLRVVMEHITTKEAVAFVEAAGPNVAATMTPQHLLFTRNGAGGGGGGGRGICNRNRRSITAFQRPHYPPSPHALAHPIAATNMHSCSHALTRTHAPQRSSRAACGRTATVCPC